MVQILPENPSFGTQLARNLGAGFSQGVSQAADFASKMAMKRAEMKNLQQLIGGDQTSMKPNNEMMTQEFIDALPQIEQHLGRDLTPQDLDQLWQGYQQLGAQQQQKSPFSTSEKLALAGHADIGRVFAEGEKATRKEQFEREKMAHEESKPTRARGRELLEDLPYKENALTTMKNSISSGNLGMLSLDNLAEISGIEGLRSPEGAAFKTASKEFFLGNLSRVGSRGLNQMMERVVLEMAPLIGRSPQANLAVTEIMDAETDVTRKEAELINDIGQSYKEKYGHYPEDLSHRVYKELRPYATQRQKDALDKIDEIKDRFTPKNKEGVLMRDPHGGLRRIPHKDLKAAKAEGYRLEK